MARDIPTTYKAPNPDLSFVTGRGPIDAESASYGGDNEPPHGMRELGDASAYAFAEGNACPQVAQLWIDTDALDQTAGGKTVGANMEWIIPFDEAFKTFEVTVYYESQLADAAAFEFKMVNVAGTPTLTIASILNAGVQTVARATWSPALGAHTAKMHIEFRAEGNAPSNKIFGVFIRRIPQNGTIGSGTHYAGTYIPPDNLIGAAYTVPYGAGNETLIDEPLTPDIVLDLKRGLEALQTNRERMYLNWSSVSTTTTIPDAILGIMVPCHIPVPGEPNRWSHTAWSIGAGAGANINVVGHKNPSGQPARYTSSWFVAAGALVTDTAYQKNGDNGMPANNPLRFMPYTVKTDGDLTTLASICIFGG